MLKFIHSRGSMSENNVFFGERFDSLLPPTHTNTPVCECSSHQVGDYRCALWQLTNSSSRAGSYFQPHPRLFFRVRKYAAFFGQYRRSLNIVSVSALCSSVEIWKMLLCFVFWFFKGFGFCLVFVSYCSILLFKFEEF